MKTHRIFSKTHWNISKLINISSELMEFLLEKIKLKKELSKTAKLLLKLIEINSQTMKFL